MEAFSFMLDGFFLILSIFGVCFGAISLGIFLRPRPVPPADRLLRFAVLVPARNEERCIAGIVESIRRQDYPQALVDIYVIPNNCTDATAWAALSAGAEILHVSPAVRSKGQALHEAFSQLLRFGVHDAYCVFDADNEANPRFLAEMNQALAAGARVAKSRILAKNAHESWVCACYETFFCNANVFLNQARQNLGFSARLIGTGFAVRRDLMEELGGWNTDTMTEDAEFYALLAARGERTAFVPGAITYDEEPLTFRASLIQRRRWMSGILEVGREKLPELLHSLTTGVGRRFALDAGLQLSFAWLQAWILPLFLLRLCADPQAALASLPMAAVSFYGSSLALGLASLLLERRLTRSTALALPLYPLFLFSFLPLQTLALFLPNRTWTPIPHSGVRLQDSKPATRPLQNTR